MADAIVRHLNKRKNDWLFRRVFICTILAFCGWVIYHLVVFGHDNALTRELGHDAFLLAGAVILLYAFGRQVEPAIIAWAASRGHKEDDAHS